MKLPISIVTMLYCRYRNTYELQIKPYLLQIMSMSQALSDAVLRYYDVWTPTLGIHDVLNERGPTHRFFLTLHAVWKSSRTDQSLSTTTNNKTRKKKLVLHKSIQLFHVQRRSTLDAIHNLPERDGSQSVSSIINDFRVDSRPSEKLHGILELVPGELNVAIHLCKRRWTWL